MGMVFSFEAYWWDEESDGWIYREFTKEYVPAPESSILTFADVSVLGSIGIADTIFIQVNHADWDMTSDIVNVGMESLDVDEIEEYKGSPEKFIQFMLDQGWTPSERENA